MPASLDLDRPTPAQAAASRRRAAGVTNRHLQLLAGLLAVAADLAHRLPLDGHAGGHHLGHDLTGVAWSLELALGVIEGVTLDPPAAPDGGPHAAALRALIELADRL
jgi:hypothetical protein